MKLPHYENVEQSYLRPILTQPSVQCSLYNVHTVQHTLCCTGGWELGTKSHDQGLGACNLEAQAVHYSVHCAVLGGGNWALNHTTKGLGACN